MTLDFNDDRTYTKDIVLENVRYALFDPKSLQDDAFSAEFLDMATVFVLMDHSDLNRPRYKIIDALDMVSLDIKLHEIMEAANENCRKPGTISCLWKMPYPRLQESCTRAIHLIRCMLGQTLNAHSELPFLCMKHIWRILQHR